MAALRSYRAFLRVAAGMPETQRRAAVEQARSELGFFRDVADAGEVSRLVDAFDSRIAFLRMTTPRRRSAQAGRVRTVYRDGVAVEGSGAARPGSALSNWSGNNLDPDAVARHNHGLQRAGFRDNAHAKGFF